MESTLNLVWLFLGLLAVGAAFASARRLVTSRKLAHVLCVSVIVVALFPYISATDDIVRVKHFAAEQSTQQQTGSKHGQSDYLLRLYEVLDAPLIANVYRLALVWMFLLFVETVAGRDVDLVRYVRAGRSPPPLLTR